MTSTNTLNFNKYGVDFIGSTLKPDSVLDNLDADYNKGGFERRTGLKPHSYNRNNLKPELILFDRFYIHNQTPYESDKVNIVVEDDNGYFKALKRLSIYRSLFVGVEIKSPNISPDNINDYIEDVIKEDLKFISALKETDSKDDLKAIDELYEYIDTLIGSNDFSRVVNLIEAVTKRSFSLRVLVGFLTITHSQQNRIANRHKLIQAAKQRAEQKGLTVTQINGILKGF